MALDPPAQAAAEGESFVGHLTTAFDGLDLAAEGQVEGQAHHARRDLAGPRWQLRIPVRVELDDQGIAGFASLDHRQDRRIGREAAVPVVVPADLHGMMQLRQASRGQDRVDRDLASLEDPRLAAGDLRRSDEEADRRRPAESREVHGVLQQGAEGIQVQRIELIGRDHAGHDVEGDLAGAAATQRREARGVGRSAPQGLQLGPGALRPVFQEAGCQGDGIEGAGAGAADPVEAGPAVLQEAVQHAPGEGAVGTAALKRQVEWLHRPGSAGPCGRRLRLGNSL